MILKILYSKQAKKFLDKNKAVISEEKVESLALKAVRKIVKSEDINIDLKALKGDWKGYYRIRFGNIRIIFNLENKTDESNITIVFFTNEIDYRGNVYD